MGEHDKVGMEEEIKERVSDTKRPRSFAEAAAQLTRSDLTMVSIHDSKSVVILSP